MLAFEWGEGDEGGIEMRPEILACPLDRPAPQGLDLSNPLLNGKEDRPPCRKICIIMGPMPWPALRV